MDDNGKDLLQSKTTWGVIITALAVFILPRFGIDITVEEQDHLTAVMSQNAEGLVALIGVILALFGNAKRKHPITSVLGMKLPGDNTPVTKGSKK
jgi:uncharacterized protein YjhX (UPF0386 family)